MLPTTQAGTTTFKSKPCYNENRYIYDTSLKKRICLLRVSCSILHWLLCLLIYYHQFSSFVFFNIPYMTQKDICYILPPFKFLQIKQRLFKRDEHKNLDKIFCPFLSLPFEIFSSRTLAKEVFLILLITLGIDI